MSSGKNIDCCKLANPLLSLSVEMDKLKVLGESVDLGDITNTGEKLTHFCKYLRQRKKIVQILEPVMEFMHEHRLICVDSNKGSKSMVHIGPDSECMYFNLGVNPF